MSRLTDAEVLLTPSEVAALSALTRRQLLVGQKPAS
jgi:hypothetical protein